MTAVKKKPKTSGKANGSSKIKHNRRTDFDAMDPWGRNPASESTAARASAVAAGDSSSPTPIEMDVAHVYPRPLGSVWREPRSNIRRSKTNPRTEFDLDDLLATMPKSQLSPVLVRFRPDTDSGTDFEIIDGERRDRAAEVLGWTDIEIKLVEMSDDEVEEAQLVANLARADLTPLDEAHAFARFQAKGYTIAQIADRVGKKQAHVRQHLALAGLTDEAKAALRVGAISVGAAMEFAALTDETAQRRAVARAVDGRHPEADALSAKQVRLYIEQEMLVLTKARFPLGDAKLHPTAGACTTCPKRASEQIQLIALTSGPGDDERCTDRSCFAAKQEAYWAREAERARVAGETVIEGNDAKKIVAFGAVAKDSGYVDLDAHCAELRDGRTWREVLGDATMTRSLVRGDASTPHIVVSKAEAMRVLRDRGLLRVPGQAPQSTAPATTKQTPSPKQTTKPANDAAPTGEPTGEPDLLTVDEIARQVQRLPLDSATLALLVDACVVAFDLCDDEAAQVCGPHGVPVPKGSDGSALVADIARGLTSDGERMALLSRAACAISQKARTLLSGRFAASSTSEDTTAPNATADSLPDDALPASGERAESAVDESIRDNVRDLLRPTALQRAELIERLADIEGITESDADSEIEVLIQEGWIRDGGEFIEWSADQFTAQRALF